MSGKTDLMLRRVFFPSLICWCLFFPKHFISPKKLPGQKFEATAGATLENKLLQD